MRRSWVPRMLAPAALAWVLVGAGAGAAGSSGTVSSLVTISPCRLVDTRPAPDNRGPRSTPLHQGESHTVSAWGDNGDCSLPSTAVGLVMNVAVVNGTAPSFLTVWPADVQRPTAASLNWVAGQAPTPNGVTTALSGDGKFSLFNFAGDVDVVIDVTGYYVPSTAGPQGPQGPPGPVNRITDAQIAMKQWWLDPGAPGVFGTGTNPQGVAFDGTSIWVANRGANNVSKINPVSGARTDYPVGTTPYEIAFDGSSLWVTNYGANTVSKLNPSTGAVLGTFPTGVHPWGVAFDGTWIWVTNSGSNNVSRIDRATGAKTDYATQTDPRGIAFDGTSIWVANDGSASVSKINPATGTKNDYPSGGAFSSPTEVAFDGTYIWVTNAGSASLSRFNTAAGTKTDFPIPGSATPEAIVYDGTSLWVTDPGAAAKLFKIHPGTGAVLATYPAPNLPYGVGFDGTSVWMTMFNASTITKINPG